MRFFGFNEAKEIVDEGMNAKMTEISAALGLTNLRHLDHVKQQRRAKYEHYRKQLGDCSFLTFQKYQPEEYNYSYLPVVFDSEERLLRVEKALHNQQVFPRRYFHPALHALPIFKGPALPVAERVAKTVLCLPLYTDLSLAEIDFICDLVRRG